MLVNLIPTLLLVGLTFWIFRSFSQSMSGMHRLLQLNGMDTVREHACCIMWAHLTCWYCSLRPRWQGWPWRHLQCRQGQAHHHQ